MLKYIFSITNHDYHKILNILGLKVKFINKKKIKNVYVGCGNDQRYGYVGCNLRKTKNAKIVCKAWNISENLKELENIYSRHMCEHLTVQEFKFTLRDWYSALKIGGTVEIIVPNIDFHIQQFLNAKFDKENFDNPNSELNYAIAAFGGWQREDYLNNNSSTKYWDVHKLIFNEKLIRLFLEEAGFKNIHTEIINNVHLKATAEK